jgi:translation initiation factor 1
MDSNSRLVYTTESGRVCPTCRQPAAACTCGRDKKQKQQPKQCALMKDDGIVRIQKETKGRGGKCVSVICGLSLDDVRLKQTAKQLKSLCGSGGTVKDGMIVIQGDHRLKIKSELEKQGLIVKLAGG